MLHNTFLSRICLANIVQLQFNLSDLMSGAVVWKYVCSSFHSLARYFEEVHIVQTNIPFACQTHDPNIFLLTWKLRVVGKFLSVRYHRVDEWLYSWTYNLSSNMSWIYNTDLRKPTVVGFETCYSFFLSLSFTLQTSNWSININKCMYLITVCIRYFLFTNN